MSSNLPPHPDSLETDRQTKTPSPKDSSLTSREPRTPENDRGSHYTENRSPGYATNGVGFTKKNGRKPPWSGPGRNRGHDLNGIGSASPSRPGRGARTRGHRRRGKGGAGDMDYDLCNLIINYLPPDMDEVELRRIFKTHGPIDSVKIVRDLKSGRSKGYGFVRYHSGDHAVNATRVLNKIIIRGKRLKVARARPRSVGYQDTNVFVSRLPPHFSDKQLHDIFQGFGKLVECRVLRDSQGNSRGTGFVRMDTHENALKSISQVNGKVLGGGSHAIEARLASTGRSAFRYSQIRSNGKSVNWQGMQGPSIESMKTMEQMFRTQAAASLANMAMFHHAMMTAPFVGMQQAMIPGMPPMTPHQMGYPNGQGFSPQGMQGFANNAQQWNGGQQQTRAIMDHPSRQHGQPDPGDLAKLFNGMSTNGNGASGGPPGGEFMRDRNGNPRLSKEAVNPMVDMFARFSNSQQMSGPTGQPPPGYGNYAARMNSMQNAAQTAYAHNPGAGAMPKQHHPQPNYWASSATDFQQMERDIHPESLLPENLI